MKPTLTVIDPGMGNLRSVCRAWERAGANIILAADASCIGNPDGLVFPGQGGMHNVMHELQVRGFDTLIREWIQADRPFFGICLGLQALFEHSEESDGPGLGLFRGRIRRFRLPPAFKIPHMGWNTLNIQQRCALDAGLSLNEDQVYFVHSYFLDTPDSSIVWMTTNYGGQEFTSAIRRGNCYATQYHPEKSQGKGLQIYANFVQLLKNPVSVV